MRHKGFLPLSLFCMDKLTKTGDVREQIENYLADNNIPFTEIYKVAPRSQSHLYRVIIKKERPMTQNLLDIINDHLGTEFTLTNGNE